MEKIQTYEVPALEEVSSKLGVFAANDDIQSGYERPENPGSGVSA